MTAESPEIRQDRRRISGRWWGRCRCGRWKLEMAQRCRECVRDPLTGRWSSHLQEKADAGKGQSG